MEDDIISEEAIRELLSGETAIFMNHRYEVPEGVFSKNHPYYSTILELLKEGKLHGNKRRPRTLC